MLLVVAIALASKELADFDDVPSAKDFDLTRSCALWMPHCALWPLCGLFLRDVTAHLEASRGSCLRAVANENKSSPTATEARVADAL